MSQIKPRLLTVKPHRAVDWNERAIAKVIKERGYVLAGIKVDGIRCLVLFIDGELRFLTRAGIEIPALAGYREHFRSNWVKEWALQPGVHVLDCEVWIPGVTFEEGSGMLRRDEPLQVQPQFVVLDILTQNHIQGEPSRDTLGAAYFARHAAIVGRFREQLRPAYAGTVYPLIVSEALAKVESVEAIKDVYGVARGVGFEGLVVKDPSAPPKNGKVSGFWKVKPGCGADFAPGWEGDGVIVGYVWGDEGKANAGKIVGFRIKLEDGNEVNATGLTQDYMLEITGTQAASKRYGWVDPYLGRYAEVKAMEKTANGSLRHPSFVRFRDLDSAQGVKA